MKYRSEDYTCSENILDKCKSKMGTPDWWLEYVRNYINSGPLLSSSKLACDILKAPEYMAFQSNLEYYQSYIENFKLLLAKNFTVNEKYLPICSRLRQEVFDEVSNKANLGKDAFERLKLILNASCL